MSTMPTTAPDTSSNERHGFTAEERAAMKERARETRRTTKGVSAAQKAAEAERAVIVKIADMDGNDRAIAEAVHDIVTTAAPQLAPKLWYGMPAYALDGTLVCFFQPAAKFKARYATLGFSDHARLDDGALWPASYAVTEIDDGVRAQIAALVRRAIA